MTLPVFTYLANKHHGHVLHDEVLCPACLEELPEAARTAEPLDRRGYEQIVSPWTGAPRACSNCGKTPSDIEHAEQARAEAAAEASMSVALCDFPMATTYDGMAIVTCDRPMCARHRTSVGPDRDHCPKHVTVNQEQHMNRTEEQGPATPADETNPPAPPTPTSQGDGATEAVEETAGAED